MKLKKVAEAKLPTKLGKFIVVGFEEYLTNQNHLALLYGNCTYNKQPVLTRMHSECLTGDALFSLRCDCGFQLESALHKIRIVGKGVLLYHRQEGRNIGLLNKINAYALQDKGLDTVEANKKLGFAADERDFSICVEMLNILGIHSVMLLTNNPMKVYMLKKMGINVVKRIPLIVGKNINNVNYLKTKMLKMGHLL